MHRRSDFHEIMREQTSISANDLHDWPRFILKTYGVDLPRSTAVCPTPATLATATPNVLWAPISFLASGKQIPMHPGPFWGVLRFYLVLSMPLAADGRSMEVLVIVDLEHRLTDFEYLNGAEYARRTADEIVLQ
jgi:aspartate beta-hydroxylase